LLDNALKFTPAGRTIRASVKREGDQAVLRVDDQGEGIEPETLRHMFDLFAQGEQGLSRPKGGLGIGLAIVKRLAELQGGTVEAHSDGAGRGSEFIVRFPISAAQANPSVKASSEPELTIRRDILIVDDNRDSAQTLSDLLRTYGHKTHVAYDGNEALDVAQRLRPEVVLLDIGLPTLNGYDACRSIRSQPWGERMVLVALTGYGQDSDVLKARQAGFDHHMVKPVNHQALQAILAAMPAHH
jgi:CheY-like chemotaxis protein